MNGRTLKFQNVIDEFSRVCLAIRVGRRCRAVDVIDTIEELLKLYPPPTHLRMDNGPEFMPTHCKGGAQAVVWERRTSCQAHPGTTHLWSHSMAGLGTSFCRRSRPEAISLTVCLAARSKAAGRAAPKRVQRLHTAFDSPGACAPGESNAVESGLITPLALIRTGVT